MKHQHISWFKSLFRIAGYAALLFNGEYAVALLIISELIGIVEEVGHD